MKQLIIIFFATIVSLNLNAQTQTKNHLVDDTYHQWRWNDDGCINKWSATFENKTNKTITSLTFRLVVEEKGTGVMRYKKLHTVSLTIHPNETVPSPYFNLSQELCGIDNPDDLENYYFFTEIVSFK